jgi:hypothetical protein
MVFVVRNISLLVKSRIPNGRAEREGRWLQIGREEGFIIGGTIALDSLIGASVRLDS